MIHGVNEGQVSEESETESEIVSTQSNNKSLISLSFSIANCTDIQTKWLPSSSSLKVIGPDELKHHLKSPESMYKSLQFLKPKFVFKKCLDLMIFVQLKKKLFLTLFLKLTVSPGCQLEEYHLQNCHNHSRRSAFSG